MAPPARQPLGSLSRLFVFALLAVALFVIFRPTPAPAAPKVEVLPPRTNQPTAIPAPSQQPDRSAPSAPQPSDGGERLDDSGNDHHHGLHYHTTRIDNVTVRGREGEPAFRGTVDVANTLARIAARQTLPFPDDGIAFENRERRLPARLRGYYHEFVHPTPELRGPGAQRIIIGEQGEVYYTPDHYRTFQRL